MGMIRGCDVSAIQGVVPWDKVKAAGCDFALLRCAVGNESYVDSKFAANVAGARDAGLIVGTYFFTYPLRHLDPKLQAQDHARKADVGGHPFGSNLGELPPAADLEWPPRESRAKDGTLVYDWRDKWKIDAPFIRDWCFAYLEEMARIWGCTPIVYTYPYWWKCLSEAGGMDPFANHPLWLADYFAIGRVPAEYEIAMRKVPAPWTKALIIQHDGDGGLKLSNGVDADFNVAPDEDALRALMLSGDVTARTPDAPTWPSLEDAKAEGARILVEEAIAAYRREREDREP